MKKFFIFLVATLVFSVATFAETTNSPVCAVAQQSNTTANYAKQATTVMERAGVGGDDWSFDKCYVSKGYLVCQLTFIDLGYIQKNDAHDFSFGFMREFTAASKMIRSAQKAGLGYKVVVKTISGRSQTFTYANSVFRRF